MRRTLFSLHPFADVRRSLFPRFRRGGALLLVTALLASLFAVLAPHSQAAIPAVELGGFENDGNQDDASLGVPIDWQTVKTDPLISEWALIHDDNDADTNDSTQIDSAKEQDPPAGRALRQRGAPERRHLPSCTWPVGSPPPSSSCTSATSATRSTGDTDINVEFNQVSVEFSCPDDTDGRVRWPATC